MKLLHKLRALFRREKLDAEMAEEMREHLELRTRTNLSSGLSPSEARAAARRQFGGLDQLKEIAREQRGIAWLEHAVRDLRFALRQLTKAPAFTLTVVATLAIGLGACTAIFSVVNSVLLRPLAYPEPDQLVRIFETKLPQVPEFAVAAGNYFDWREQAQSFEQLAAVRGATYNLTGQGEPRRVVAQRITPNYFSTLRTRPVLGRDFSETDVGSKIPLVILSHGFWLRQFGGRREILDETIQLNGQPVVVVGVMPKNFQPGSDIELFTSIGYAEGRENHGSHDLGVYGRLKPGVTLEQARSELALIADRLVQQYPKTNTGWSVKITPLLEFTVGSVRPMLFSLLGAVGLLLLVACANIANLLLARATVRAKEMAVRVALGASRGRIVRQLLVESVLLAVLGGALGVLGARWGIDGLLALAPEGVPRAAEIALDFRALAFAGALMLIAGLGFGLFPAFQAAQINPNEALKGQGRGTSEGGRSRRLRGALVVAEVALALILLVGAGLFGRSFVQLQKMSPGFHPGESLAVNLTLPGRKYATEPQRAAFVAAATARLAVLPGVQTVAAAHLLPFSNDDHNLAFTIAGRPPLPIGEMNSTLYYSVTPDYFKTMEIPLRRGRFFSASDVAGAPRVVVINESLAKKHFPDQDPIGQRLKVTNAEAEIIGVVADVKHYQLDLEAKPQVYEPFAQLPFNFMTFVVRPSGRIEGLPAAIRNAIYEVDRDQPISAIRPLASFVAASIALPRFAMFLFTVFSAVALLLAAIGIHGVMAYSVAQRTGEIGIRVALGARHRDIMRLVFSQGGKLVALGLVCGLAGALAVTRFIGSMLVEVSPYDPLTFAILAVFLAAVAALACWFPARRATKVDPIVALRTE